MMSETWKPVLGWESTHEVSSLGNVRTVARLASWHHSRSRSLFNRLCPARPIKQWVGKKTGYPMVTLAAAGRKEHQAVHAMVLGAFVGARPSDRHVACHCDGSRTNNALSNLRWDTYEGNEADKLIHDTHIRGERNYKAKLTEIEVGAIRASGEKQDDLAKRYGVSQVCISLIQRRKNWSWLGKDE
jgi:hypothetical protein